MKQRATQHEHAHILAVPGRPFKIAGRVSLWVIDIGGHEDYAWFRNWCTGRAAHYYPFRFLK